jgi:uncharacterized protein YdeI (BOF family)
VGVTGTVTGRNPMADPIDMTLENFRNGILSAQRDIDLNGTVVTRVGYDEASNVSPQAFFSVAVDASLWTGQTMTRREAEIMAQGRLDQHEEALTADRQHTLDGQRGE